MVEIYQPARQSKGDLAVFTARGLGEGERKANGASWEKTIIQNLPKSFLEVFFPVAFSFFSFLAMYHGGFGYCALLGPFDALNTHILPVILLDNPQPNLLTFSDAFT